MLLWLSRVDALSKLASGKFVAKDGAELCSSPEEHFLGKEKQAALTGAPNPSEIGTKLRNRHKIEYAAMAQEVEHFLGKEEVTGSNPVSSSIYGHLRIG